MLKKSLLTISLLTLAGCNTMAVNESPSEIENTLPEYPVEETSETPAIHGYECYPLFDNDEENPVLLLISNEDPDVGAVALAEDVIHEAQYAVRGLERHWSFGCDDGHCNYRIDLQANGTAHYYDFTHEDEVKSSLILKCK